ncbi:MAG: tripartite tricarboxylate transporter permease [Rhodospirillaceae bacterium]|jgi:TctA family transporter|nr:tripartite tricarboxylate transporter permease [Rhodospirillaceae bacterium]MBT5940031.1 tripartite tricarboxylate transporter permease [Rhodospirillaceae bacterium]MBT7268319.1 tripartite tricarboxylate transporter permease [Rhodospirillaceae bacterium]
MLDMAVKAAIIMTDPNRLMFLGLGVLIGLVVGVIPGLGGLVGLSLLLPFTYDMDPYTAMAFLIGLSAVVATSDTIPAVLFGVPGTVGSAATILDGFPMARNGEAGRAFGAAFTASVLGGLFGAFLLGISIPVLQPIMLKIASPELLAFCFFGLSLVVVLGGGAPVKGFVAATAGLMIATIGEDPNTATARWTLDTIYLSDGLPVVPLALGLFAIPEIADLVITKARIANSNISMGSKWTQLKGVKDVISKPFLLLRCSAIGSFLGAIPGLGAAVIDWIAYGHAARSEKGANETFGKGDVRGVIASESSNNAKEGGALVPTVAFGVPGSASMALLLGAFLIHGLVPGPDMLTTHLDVTYTLVWSIAIANILGAGICFIFANQLAKIALIRIGILAPVVLSITFVGAFSSSRQWGDIVALLLVGFLGWIMKRLGWPRPPLLLGFVLGALVERYMFISVTRYGIDWLSRPIVIAVLVITAFGLLRPLYQKWRSFHAAKKESTEIAPGPKLRLIIGQAWPDTIFAAALTVLFGASLIISSEWEFEAKLVPQVIGWAGLAFALIVTLSRSVSFGTKEKTSAGVYFDIQADYGDLTSGTVFRRFAIYFAWCLFPLAAAFVVGLLPALLLFLIGFLRMEGKEKWPMVIAVSLGTWTFSYILFHLVLHIPWPQSLIGDLLPFLRSTNLLNIF